MTKTSPHFRPNLIRLTKVCPLPNSYYLQVLLQAARQSGHYVRQLTTLPTTPRKTQWRYYRRYGSYSVADIVRLKAVATSGMRQRPLSLWTAHEVGRKLETGEFSDLLIKCGGREWHVHRIIVCAWSPFLRIASEQNCKEASSKVIDLTEDVPENVHRMLYWMYTKDYSDGIDREAVAINAAVYSLADKYGILALKDRAKEKFLISKQHHCRLKRYPSKSYDVANLNALLDAIPIIYTSTPSLDRGLRQLVMEELIWHKIKLEGHEEFLQLFKSGLADGEFALDVHLFA
ncbi:MAG: hypothetical protein Q9163_004386 [Psora crenata]